MGRLLSVEDVTLKFTGLVALDSVSLSVNEGDLFAVIGPNGAGKTSLFNCISGLYRATSGHIRFGDTEITQLAAHRIARLGVARMFQNLALFPQLTVQENMLLGRHHLYETSWFSEMLWLPSTIRSEAAHRAKVEEIIDFLNLERHRKTPVAILPYGVLKRVELGRALCMEPRLLLLDEPAAGLNHEETEDLARYLLDIKEELHITQILIEHELPFVLELADHIVVLDFGKKIAEGTPDVVRSDPAVVEAYVGTGAQA